MTPEPDRHTDWNFVNSLIPQPIAKLEHKWWCAMAATNTDATFVLTAGRDDGTCLWKKEGNRYKCITLSEHQSYELHTDSDRKTLALLQNEQTLQIIDISSGNILKTHSAPAAIQRLAISADGKRTAWTSTEYLFIHSVTANETTQFPLGQLDPSQVAFGGTDQKTLVASSKELSVVLNLNTDANTKPHIAKAIRRAGEVHVASNSDTHIWIEANSLKTKAIPAVPSDKSQSPFTE